MYPNYYHHFNVHISSGTDFWSALAAVGTLLAVLVALFADRIWKYLDRPIVHVSFDRQSERCFRTGMILQDNLQDQEWPFFNVTRQYFRLRVLNSGRSAVRKLKAKIELYEVEEERLADRFEPTALKWVTNSETIDLASDEDSYVNLISQVTQFDPNPEYPEGIRYELRVGIADLTQRGIAWDRRLKAYKLRVVFHGENLRKPIVKFFLFSPETSPGTLEETSSWERAS